MTLTNVCQNYQVWVSACLKSVIIYMSAKKESEYIAVNFYCIVQLHETSILSKNKIEKSNSKRLLENNHKKNLTIFYKRQQMWENTRQRMLAIF